MGQSCEGEDQVWCDVGSFSCARVEAIAWFATASVVASSRNAYVAPLMSRYLGRISEEAGARRFSIMGSNGGAIPVERAR